MRYEYQNYKRRVEKTRDALRDFLQIAPPPAVTTKRMLDNLSLAWRYLDAIVECCNEVQEELKECDATSSRPGRDGEVRVQRDQLTESGMMEHKEVWFKP